MEVMEIVKAELSGILETAGESGVTEGQVVAAIVKHGIDYHTALNSLRNTYKEVLGVERTPEHSGAVIFYKKTKQKKGPNESMAIRLAKKLGKRTIGEKERIDILNQYRR